MSECTHDCSSCSQECSERSKESLLEKPHDQSNIKKGYRRCQRKGRSWKIDSIFYACR